MGLWDSLTSALGIGNNDEAPSASTSATNDSSPAIINPSLSSILQGVGIGTTSAPNSGWNQDAEDAITEQRDAQDGYEASQQTQQPSVLQSVWNSALGGLGSVGNAAKNIATSPITGALAPLIGAGVGYAASSGLRDQSQQAYQDMVNAAKKNISVGPSAAENLQDSGSDLSARALAMDQVQQRALMGLTPDDLAQLKAARQQSDQSFQADQSKIQTDLQRRGMALSPALQMAQQQQAAQSEQRNQADLADKIASTSFNAKQAAAQQLGTMANTNLQQDFGRGLAKAQNVDSIAQFNANQAANTAARTAAATSQQGAQLGNAAASKAGSISGIGNAVGTAVGTYNANKK